MALRIHRPTPSNIDAILDAMRAMHQESGVYGKFPLNEGDCRAIVEALISKIGENVFFEIATDDDGTCAGFIAAEVLPDLWTDALITSEHGVYVRPEYRGGKGKGLGRGIGRDLMSSYIAWARRHADILRIAVVAGIDDKLGGAFMEAHGLEPRGRFYGMEF